MRLLQMERAVTIQINRDPEFAFDARLVGDTAQPFEWRVWLPQDASEDAVVETWFSEAEGAAGGRRRMVLSRIDKIAQRRRIERPSILFLYMMWRQIRGARPRGSARVLCNIGVVRREIYLR